MTKHELAPTATTRGAPTAKPASRALAVRLPGIRALRDVTLDDLDANRDPLPERVFRRCRHVVTENARVAAAADALGAGPRRASAC